MNLPVLAAGDVMGHLVNSQEIHFGPWTIPLQPLNEALKHSLGDWFPAITKHAVMMMVAALVVGFAAVATARRAVRAQGRGLLANSVEATAIFLRDQVVRPGIGDHHAARWFPWLATVFFFILACNLIGLLPPPFGSTATGNIWVTAGLASLTLLAMIGAGMAEKGVLGYWASIVPHGVAWWMWPLVWFIELFGHFTKPFALTVRLFANMTAGHVILAVMAVFLVAGSSAFWAGEKGLGGLLGLKLMVAPPSVFFALFITVFEVLIAFIQAYIFTILTSIFVGLCISHDH